MRLKPARELAQRGAGVLGVDEAERGEPFLGRVRAQRSVTGERVEQRSEEEPLVDRAHRRLVRRGARRVNASSAVARAWSR